MIDLDINFKLTSSPALDKSLCYYTWGFVRYLLVDSAVLTRYLLWRFCDDISRYVLNRD